MCRLLDKGDNSPVSRNLSLITSFCIVMSLRIMLVIRVIEYWNEDRGHNHWMFGHRRAESVMQTLEMYSKEITSLALLHYFPFHMISPQYTEIWDIEKMSCRRYWLIHQKCPFPIASTNADTHQWWICMRRSNILPVLESEFQFCVCRCQVSRMIVDMWLSDTPTYNIHNVHAKNNLILSTYQMIKFSSLLTMEIQISWEGTNNWLLLDRK